MNAVDTIKQPNPQTIKQETSAAMPNWMQNIAGYIECLSLSEAKDILNLLLPNAAVRIQNKASLVAIKNNIKCEIKATGMKHDWSEDHSSDCIEVNVYYLKSKAISKKYELQRVASIKEILLDCRFCFI
jgi:hypothetical protein